MFKEIIGVHHENSGETSSGVLNVAACGGLIKTALGFMWLKYSNRRKEVVLQTKQSVYSLIRITHFFH